MSDSEAHDAGIHDAITGILDDGEIAVSWVLVVDVADASRRFLLHRAGGGTDGADRPTIWTAIGMLQAGVRVAEDQLLSITVDDEDDDDDGQ